MIRFWPVFVLIILFSTHANAQERLFMYSNNSTSMDQILIADSSGWVSLIEIDPESKKPITSDTLRTWVQHYGPGGEMNPIYTEADLVVSCYPSFIDDTSNHVLPDVFGKIGILSGNKYVVVFDEKQRRKMFHKYKSIIQEKLSNEIKTLKIKQ